MREVIVIRHSKEDEPSIKYMASLRKNEDGSYTASVGQVDKEGYHSYIEKHGKHFNKKLEEYASSNMLNSNNSAHTWTSEQVQNVCNVHNLHIPSTSTIYDVTYTANMAYADFYPHLLNEHQCILYAIDVANDKDGYEGIQLSRWIADIMCKREELDWNRFI